MTEVWYLSLTEVSALLRQRQLSPVELTRAMLDRIARLDTRLHSYITVLPEAALAQATIAEREIGDGIDRGPLHGVPIAIKDLCCTQGVPTTCASRVLADWRPTIDATVVTRLHAAGAVMLGKLNLTEFALSGYSPGLPVPENPWHPGLHPGLSSSGSGVATAAGLCFGSLGTDTGGSIRFPSAWCGVVGLKPTYGRVSRYGVFPLGMSLDHVGPITRRVADAAVMFDAIAGYDPADATSLSAPAPACRAAIGRPLRGVRLGYDEDYVGGGAQPEVVAALRAAIDVLVTQGAELVEVVMPPMEAALEAWSVLCSAEALVAHADTFPSRADEYGPTFRSFLEYGNRLPAKEYARAHALRMDLAQAFQRVFAHADVMVCPGSFMPAPPREAIPVDGPYDPAFGPFGRFTVPFNFSGNPTLSVPNGFTEDGVPHGMQLVGPHLGEARLCQVGHAYEAVTPWHLRRPPDVS